MPELRDQSGQAINFRKSLFQNHRFGQVHSHPVWCEVTGDGFDP